MLSPEERRVVEEMYANYGYSRVNDGYAFGEKITGKVDVPVA